MYFTKYVDIMIEINIITCIAMAYSIEMCPVLAPNKTIIIENSLNCPSLILTSVFSFGMVLKSMKESLKIIGLIMITNINPIAITAE